jgi:GT2 family glycosyltransferase
MKSHLTALIVSFLRYEYLEKCIESLRTSYPDINIIVGNNGPEDGRKEKLCQKHGARYYQLPFDCGICVGRNILVEKIKTPYTLIGDDDFYYDNRAKVEEMLEVVRAKEADLVGGRVEEGGITKNYQGFIFDKGKHFVYEKLPDQLANGDKLVKVDITFNYFVARTKMLKDVKWDEQIKVAYEHSAFFIDAKRKGYSVCFHPKAIVIHKPFIEKSDPGEYEQYKFFRMRKNDKKRFFQKYQIDYVIDMGGRKDVYDGTGMDEVDFLITVFERWDKLEQLLFSIAKHCPNAHIAIADQSKKFYAKKYLDLYFRLAQAGLKNKPMAFNLPYDCGVSYCRNYLHKITARKYKLILEEDFVFTEKTDIRKLVDVMEADPQVGAVGGMVLENGCPVDFVNDIMIDYDVILRKKKTIQFLNPADGYNKVLCDLKYTYADTVANFTLFRKECLDEIKWDENIKIHGEHTDFYLNWKETSKHKVAYTPDVVINHDKSNQDPIYKDLRRRTEFLVYMFEKNRISRVIYKNGQTIELKDGKFIKYRTKI